MNRLGKGIEALINSKNLDSGDYLDGLLDINKIKANPDQPRKHFDEKLLKELVESIREKGILQPITVKSLDDGDFELIAGERRLRAAQILKLESIPAYVIKVESDAEKLELALIENIQRSDLNTIEEAEAYSILRDKYSLTHEQIAKRVGKSRTEITRTLDLIKLPENIKSSLIENANDSSFPFSRGHARTILTLKDPVKIQTLFQRIINEKISVRKTEQLVKKINSSSISPKPTRIKNILEEESNLSGILEAKVEVSNSRKYIRIRFKSEKDKSRIINIISSSKKWNKNLCKTIHLVPKFILSIAYEK